MPQDVGVNVDRGAVVTTFAGNGAIGTIDGVGSTAYFNHPAGVSLNDAGGLYVADYENHAIRLVDLATRAVTTVAGIPGSLGGDAGATPLQSKFRNPYGVEVDSAGNVYVADMGNSAIRMLSGGWVAGTIGKAGSTDAAV